MGIRINGQNDTITATDGGITVGTNLTVPGVLTYEDVTNVDAIGLSTFQNGLHVTGGNVGIGTTNPTRKLDVEIQTASFSNGSVLNSHPIAEFTNLSDGAPRGLEIGAPADSVSSPVYLKVSGTGNRFAILDQNDHENFTILDSGNVGIGTDNPTDSLNILKDATGAGSGGLKLQTAGSNESYLTFGVSSSLGKAIFTSSFNGGGTALPMVFAVGSSSTDERLRIDSSGNVGIGTDNPQKKLQVQGDVRLVDVSPRIGFHDDNAADNTQCTGGIEIFDQNGIRGAYMGATEGAGFLSFGISTTAGANPTEKVRISRIGLVGIRTDDPKTPVDINCYSSDSGAYRGTVKINRYGHILQQNNTVVNNTGVSSYWALAPRDNGEFDISFAEVDAPNTFNASGFDVLTLQPNGNVSIPNGNLAFASGNGIDFSATSDASGMDSEILDDYEEGTWNPGLQLNSQSGSFTFTGNNGARYTKIGRVVYVNGIIEWSNHNLTAGTNLQVTGLPFTSANSNQDRSGISISYTNSPWTGISVYQQALRSETNATYMTFNYSNATDGSIDNVPNYNQVNTSGTFIFFGMYIVT